MEKTLQRFLQAQQRDYGTALSEIRSGRKRSHWMWYIFPQLQGLGYSDMAKFYALQSQQEAKDYLEHPILGKRLLEISEALHKLDQGDARSIFGSPDYLKLHSSMTLFSTLPHAPDIFRTILNQFFNGQQDQQTLNLLQNERNGTRSGT